MDRTRHPLAALAGFLAVATFAAGCGAPHQSAPPSASSTPIPTVASSRSQTVSPPTPPNDGHGGRGGRGNGSSAATSVLPADWPPELPVPQGSIMGSTGSAGRWTVLIVAAGSAAEVRRSTVAFYSAAGFTAVSNSVLNKGNRQITLVVENRDHSATQTNLVIYVTTG
ncbi:MAG TPA: hypothetical protein VIM01_01690 [Dermatophilaceae bacterium]